MNKDKQKVWERLKYVPPTSSYERRIIEMGRRMGKMTIAAQAFGRAIRDMQDKE